MKAKASKWIAAALAVFFGMGISGALASSEQTVYSSNFNVLENAEIKPVQPTETAAAGDRQIIITSEMADLLVEGQEFVLHGQLVGYEDQKVQLQWQYDTGRDEDGDGEPDGWKDAPGKSQRLTLRVQASEETVKARWRLRVTLEE